MQGYTIVTGEAGWCLPGDNTLTVTIKPDIPVLIVGAGPVGLTLAADLAWRNVPCMLVDRQREVVAHPRAISIGVRTMEHFRRLGLDQQVIDAGVPRNQTLDVVYVTRMLHKEVFRFSIPSINDLIMRADELAAHIPETTASPYYKTWTAQAPLERVLRTHLATCKHANLRTGWKLTSFEEFATHVSVTLRDESSGREETITCSYLAGCDGAKSTVRRGLGIAMSGSGTLGTAMGLYFRAPELRKALGTNPGVMYWMLAPDCGGTIYTINGGEEWVYNRYFNTHEEALGLDPLAAIHAAIGKPVEVEIISALDWQPCQLVADSYGGNRVFLAGDACHLLVPTGGLGMNTGIGDAADLAWKIEASLAGWGGPNLLTSYDLERRPIGTQNTLEAADNYNRSREIQSGLAEIEDDGEMGESVRATIAAKLPLKIKHFAPIGVHLGYRYEGSPIVVADGTPEPDHEAAAYRPTTRPGHRAPHVYITPGQSTLDAFGRGFVLLCCTSQASDVSSLADAAHKSGVPLTIKEISNLTVCMIYEKRFVLVRPDGHIAWRGDSIPENATDIINIVTGRMPA